MTICVEDLRADLKAIGFDLMESKGFKYFVTKWVDDSASFTVASITKTQPHLWSVNFMYFQHKLRDFEQSDLIAVLDKYSVRGD